MSEEINLNNLRKQNNSIEDVKVLFSSNFLNLIPKILSDIENKENTASRIEGEFGKNSNTHIIDKYGYLENNLNTNSQELVKSIISDFFKGVPLWRSPNLQYNVGASVNRVSSVLYSIANDLNIFNINDGLGGNVVLAEKAVTNILSSLAEVDPLTSCGFFTFGGTGTNLYAIKIGISKAIADSRSNGISKNLKVFLTEDAHFSHLNSLNWLGIGTDNALVIKANKDRTSSIIDAENKLRIELERGNKIGAIVINGGTTYDHTIDDIKSFVSLRDKLVKEYKLEYIPHIHVDSVIGWAWLMFQDYDFDENPLAIEESTLNSIKSQYNKIKDIRLADSWGVDFHKGVGACPIPCSLIMINSKEDAALLSYDEKADKHQLAKEFSHFSPVDFTLETSRPGGAPLAALGALHAFGRKGYQAHLSNLVQMNQLFRKLITESNRTDIEVLNKQCPGYVTMVRVYPKNLNIQNPRDDKFFEKVNSYMKDFFAFDLKQRMSMQDGVEYSYSSKYIVTNDGQKIGALKFYPTSPSFGPEHVEKAFKFLISQKDIFDNCNC